MSGCRICRSAIEPFIDFGRMPLANGFLTPDQFADEYFFDLSAATVRVARWCSWSSSRSASGCSTTLSVLLRDLVAHGGALRGSGRATSSRRCRRTTRSWSRSAATTARCCGTPRTRAFAISGSSRRPTWRGRERRGRQTTCAFFERRLARADRRGARSGDAIIAANTLSHIADCTRSSKASRILLAPDGTCVIEDPYWGDVVAKTSFDQIYDEHASYFTLSSVTYLFAQHGLDGLRRQPFDVHGGSMRT